MKYCICDHGEEDHGCIADDDKEEFGNICWVTYCECPGFVERKEEKSE